MGAGGLDEEGDFGYGIEREEGISVPSKTKLKHVGMYDARDHAHWSTTGWWRAANSYPQGAWIPSSGRTTDDDA